MAAEKNEEAEDEILDITFEEDTMEMVEEDEVVSISFDA